MPMNPGIIVSNGYTLTINGPVVGSPMHPWLSGFVAGEVKFGGNVRIVYSDWFGLISDGSTDDIEAMQLAINATTILGMTIIGKSICAISRPLDIKGRKVLLFGTLRPTSSFAGAVMTDGVTSTSIVYISGNSGADDGARFSGMHNSNNWDLDCSDSSNIARADYAVQINNTHHYLVSDLLIRRAKISNILIHGLGFSGDFERIYSAWSPYGYKIWKTIGDSQGNTKFNCCYANVCATGFYAKGAFNTILSSCGADACDIALHVEDNGRITANGFNGEGTTKVAIVSDGTIEINNGLISYVGTESSSSIDSYSGRVGAPGSATGVYLFDIYRGDLTIKNVLLSNLDGSEFEWAVYFHNDNAAKLVLGNNWANYPTFPAKGIFQNFANGIYPNGESATIATSNIIIDHDLLPFATLESGNSAPSIREARNFMTAGSTTITDFRGNGKYEGREICIRATGSITISVSSSDIVLKGGINFAMAINDTLILRYMQGVWHEISRSIAAASSANSDTALTFTGTDTVNKSEIVSLQTEINELKATLRTFGFLT